MKDLDKCLLKTSDTSIDIYHKKDIEENDVHLSFLRSSNYLNIFTLLNFSKAILLEIFPEISLIRFYTPPAGYALQLHT
jgi:hypothetical protein